MRGLGLVVALIASPAWAVTGWVVLRQTPARTVAIDLASLGRLAEGIRFRERHSLHNGQIGRHSR